MSDANTGIHLSVIIPVGSRHADVRELYADYKLALDGLKRTYEFIFVLDGPRRDVMEGLEDIIQAGGSNIIVVALNRAFGESTAIMSGFERASGEAIMTLPAYHQVNPEDIAKLVDTLAAQDVAVGWRWPRAGGVIERLRRASFHRLVATVTGMHLHDLGCGARAMRRRVLEELQLYGDQHRLLAVLAERRGFSVSEVEQ